MHRFIGVAVLTPRVWLFMSVLAIFPFISTVEGASLKLAGLEIWKLLWLVWLVGLAIYIAQSKTLFVRKGGKIEPVLWLFILFMLVFSPAADLVVDPWKNWFFCSLAVCFFQFMVLADGDELSTMIKSALALWWAYALLLTVYANSVPFYPGCIQHQFFLSGLLGLVAGMFLLLRYAAAASGEARGLSLLLLLSAVGNVLLNLLITEARSVFPYTLSLVLIGTAWLLAAKRPARLLARRLGLPVAILITLLPLAHLSGALGNLLNELSYPIFGKLRTVESKSGREVAFQVWSGFVADNARLLGPAKKPPPTVKQEADVSEKPLFGISDEKFREIKTRGMQAQNAFAVRQRNLGVELNTSAHSPLPTQLAPHSASKVAEIVPNTTTVDGIAITSSHNQWLDAAVRGGLVYAAAIALAFTYVVWLVSERLSANLSWTLTFSYWTLAVAWGFASQFDDEHWLYHIPYLTLFFLPIIASGLRMRMSQSLLYALD